ncbi:MAG: hypothetical protein HYZ52_02125 [Candidatus Omnitrophica bacterium]|nr:hypothetical protein [Candidatus Omnitrophota bacterium]
MKRFSFLVAISLLIPAALWAEETAAPAASSSDTASSAPAAAPALTETAPAPVSPAPAAEATTAPAADPATEVKPASETAPAEPAKPAAENLEFVSGEISAVDEANKSITVKLYGETENASKEKTLSVKLDTTTDITDGEKDRDLKSLTAGTEVDVEYDPATNKATYIFVY